mgnify:CR=1 FL=1
MYTMSKPKSHNPILFLAMVVVFVVTTFEGLARVVVVHDASVHGFT